LDVWVGGEGWGDQKRQPDSMVTKDIADKKGSMRGMEGHFYALFRIVIPPIPFYSSPCRRGNATRKKAAAKAACPS